MPSKFFERLINLQLFGDGDASTKTGGYSAEYVQELRNEAASWRTKLRETEGELKKANDQITELSKKVRDADDQYQKFVSQIREVLKLDESVKPEDISAKIKEATAASNVSVEKAQEALRKSAFMAAALKYGVRKEALEDAYKLVADWSSVKVDLESMSVFQVDKDGKQIQKDGKPVNGLDSLAEALVKEKPYLVGSRVTTIGSPSNPPGDRAKPPEESFGTILAKSRKDLAEKLSKYRDQYFPEQ